LDDAFQRLFVARDFLLVGFCPALFSGCSSRAAETEKEGGQGEPERPWPANLERKYHDGENLTAWRG
jgi:hypothetical protein